jgi:hypothetical protein
MLSKERGGYTRLFDLKKEARIFWHISAESLSKESHHGGHRWASFRVRLRAKISEARELLILVEERRTRRSVTGQDRFLDYIRLVLVCVDLKFTPRRSTDGELPGRTAH